MVGRARGRAARVRRSCSPTTSATSTPTRSRASARSRCASAPPGRARCTSRASPARFVAVVAVRRSGTVGAARARSPRRSRSRRCGSCGPAPIRRRSSPRSSARSRFQLVLAALLAVGLLARLAVLASRTRRSKPPSTAGLLERQRVPAVEPHVRDVAPHALEHARARSRSYFSSALPVTSATGIVQLARGDPTSVPSRPLPSTRRHAARILGRERAPFGEPRRVGGHRSRTSAARATSRGTRRRRRARRARRAARRPRRARRAPSGRRCPATRSRARAPRTSVGPVEREPQAQAAAHRVADVDARAALARRSPRRSPRTSRAAARRARAPRTLAHDLGARRAHERRRLREAGNEHDRGHAAILARRGAMSERDATTSFAATLVDEWARVGRRPTRSSRPDRGRRRSRSRSRATSGSTCTSCSTSVRPRSARSASASRRVGPRCVLCTSGTAAANFHPAVVEARARAGSAARVHRRPAARAARHPARVRRSTRPTSTATRSAGSAIPGPPDRRRRTRGASGATLACRAVARRARPARRARCT